MEQNNRHIAIPENATNGDIVMMLIKLLCSDEMRRVDTTISLTEDHTISVTASDRWWNTLWHRGE